MGSVIVAMVNCTMYYPVEVIYSINRLCNCVMCIQWGSYIINRGCLSIYVSDTSYYIQQVYMNTIKVLR